MMRIRALACAVAMLVGAGCSSSDGAGGAADGALGGSGGSSASTVSANIGPEGGTLTLGGFTLEVPAGALPVSEMISITRLGASTIELPPNTVAVSDFYRLEPSGLSFEVSVKLALELPGASDSSVFFVTPEGVDDEFEISATDQEGTSLSTRIGHFSEVVALDVGDLGGGCSFHQRPCPKGTPIDADNSPWLPGDVMDGESETARSGVADRGRLDEIRASVRSAGSGVPRCLTDLMDLGLSGYDPVSQCDGPPRNPNEKRWVSPEVRDSVSALRALIQAKDGPLGPDWDVNVNGALATNCRNEGSLHNWGAAIDLALCKKSKKNDSGCTKTHERYGLLAQLAWKSRQFNWVWYEDHYHVHASVASPGTMARLDDRDAMYCEYACAIEDGTGGLCQHESACAERGGTTTAGLCAGPAAYKCCTIGEQPPPAEVENRFHVRVDEGGRVSEYESRIVTQSFNDLGNVFLEVRGDVDGADYVTTLVLPNRDASGNFAVNQDQGETSARVELRTPDKQYSSSATETQSGFIEIMQVPEAEKGFNSIISGSFDAAISTGEGGSRADISGSFEFYDIDFWE